MMYEHMIYDHEIATNHKIKKKKKKKKSSKMIITIN